MTKEIKELRREMNELSEVNQEIPSQLADLQDAYNKQAALHSSFEKRHLSANQWIALLQVISMLITLIQSLQDSSDANSNPKQQKKVLYPIGDSTVKHTEVDRLMSFCEGKFSDSKKFIS